MTFKRVFKWGMDEEYGHEGWMPTFVDGGNAIGNGFAIAHDALEHFPHCIGGFEGEMLALGQMMFIRYETGKLDRGYYSGATTISSDIQNFLRAVFSGEQSIDEPPPIGEVMVGNMPDDEFDIIARRSVMQFIKEESHNEEQSRSEILRNLPTDAAKHIANWMRLGYVRAYRRFDKYGHSSWRALEMFESIEQQFDQAKYMQFGQEGDELHVIIDMKNAEIRLERVELAYTEE